MGNSMIFLALFSIAFVVALLGYAIYRVLPASEYMYAIARASSRMPALLQKDDYEKLASCRSFREFTKALEETAYSTLSHSASVREFHILLERKYLGDIEDLTADTPREFRALISSSLMRYEANTIKTLVKSKLKGIAIDAALLVPTGEITQKVLDKLIAAETIGDMAVVLQRTHFAELFASNFWEGKPEEEVEEEIDLFVDSTHAKALAKAAKIPGGREFVGVLQEKALAAQIVLLVRAKLRGWKPERLKEMLGKAGASRLAALADKPLDEIASADLPDISAIRESHEAIRQGDVIQLERAIDERSTQQMESLAKMHLEGAYPIYAYILARKREKQNLQVISMGTSEGIPAESIMGMVSA